MIGYVAREVSSPRLLVLQNETLGEEIALAFRNGHTRTFGLVGFTLLFHGCGFADYEAKMASEQARIQRIDLENKYLEDPLEWPAKKESDKKETARKETDKKDPDKNYVDVFLRPPRGIDRKPLQQQRGMLYEYPRSKNDSGPILGIWIGTAVNQADFVKDVGKLFPPAVGALPAPMHVDRTVPGRTVPLAFDLQSFDDANSTYLRCIYNKGEAKVAVIFHLEKTNKLVVFPDDEKNDTDLTTKIRLCLETLGVDQEAAKLRGAFNRCHSKARGK
jgi:hypothetical protein